MHLYLDTADADRIADTAALGVIDGVTTNPSIVAEAGGDYRTAVGALDDVVDGPVFVQVTAGSADGMVDQAGTCRDWAGEVIVKLPATRAGYRALDRLRAAGIPAGITVVFSAEQAVLAAKNDATFVAPYVGRIDDAGADGVGTVRRIRQIFDAQGYGTNLLAASVRNTTQAVALYRTGVDAVTMSPELLENHVSHPATDESVAAFDAVDVEFEAGANAG
ncbi:MAG: transaldolase family protein [Salinirussus sp.]